MGISSGQNIESKKAAGPASGSEKYGGFGSEDIAKLGYNNDQQFGASSSYDPYTKT